MCAVAFRSAQCAVCLLFADRASCVCCVVVPALAIGLLRARLRREALADRCSAGDEYGSDQRSRGRVGNDAGDAMGRARTSCDSLLPPSGWSLDRPIMSTAAGNKLKPAATAGAPTQASKPLLARQATPFQTRSQQSAGSKRKKSDVIAEAESEHEDEDGADRQMDSGSDAESEGASPPGSLAAQFDAAGDDSDSGSDDSGDDEHESAEELDADADTSLPLKKKQRGESGAAAAATPKAPKLLQIRVSNDSELQFHLKQLHRLMKKLRAFATKKCVRKIKESKSLGAPESVLAQLDSDLALTKHFNLDHMALYAWRIYNQNSTGKKLQWDAESALAQPITIEKANATAEAHTAAAADAPVDPASAASAATAAAASPSPRLRELLSQVLYSPACKKSCLEYIASAMKRSRKSGQREKKIEQMAETAAKRKEKEKKLREKAEAKAKKDAAKAEKKKGETNNAEKDAADAASSASDADDAATAAAAAAPAKSKKSAASTPAASSSSSSDSESESDSDARASKREEKLKRREKVKQKSAATSESNGAAAAASSSPPAVDRRVNQGPDSSSGDSDSSSSDDSDASIGAPKKKKPTLASRKPSRVFSGLCVGKLVSGVVSGVEKFGLFIEFWYKKKERKGLCHISMVSDAYIADLASEFARGDTVHAIVTKLDEKTGRISLGLKASLFPEGKKPKPALHTSKTAVAPVEKSSGGEGKDGKLESMFMDTLHAPKKDAAEVAKLDNIKKFLTQVSSTGAARTVTSGANKNRLGQRERRKLITAVLGDEANTKSDAGHAGGKHVQAWKRKQLEREAEKKGSIVPTFAKHDESSPASKPDLSGIPTTPGASAAGENRRAKRLKMHADAIAAGKTVNPLAAAAVAAAAAGIVRGPKPPKPASAAAASSHAPSVAKAASFARPASSSATPRDPRPASAADPRAAAAPAPRSAAAAPLLSTEEMHPSWQAKQMQAAKAAAAPQGKKIRFD